jgi:hypothetical protein
VVLLAVVLEAEASVAVPEVDPVAHVAVVLADLDLRLRPGESGVHDPQSQPRLSRRLDAGVGEPDELARLDDSRKVHEVVQVLPKLGHGHQTRMRERIQGCQRHRPPQVPAEVHGGPTTGGDE